MSFKKRHPDFAAIEHHIRRAHAERAVVIATLFADGIMAAVRGLRRLVGLDSTATRAGNRQRAIKATVARPVARY